MAHIEHRWPGLTPSVYLPDWLPVSVRIINHERFRSYSVSTAHVKTTWHDTGNPNTTAEEEYRWAAGGRQGAGVGGYNGIFDDDQLIITQPFNEVVWAAGTAIGNRTSYAFEQAWGSGVNFDRSIEVGAAVHGGLIAARGWSIDALVQHFFWYGKNCPGQIRAKGIWPVVVRKVQSYAAAARAAAGGDEQMYPEHMTESVARDLFGKVVIASGKPGAGTYQFDPKGSISQAWLEFGKASDRFPELKRVNVSSTGNKWFIFEGGMVLYDPAGPGAIVLVGQ